MKRILLALLLLISVKSFSQLSKTHYIPALSNSAGLPAGIQFLYISTPSKTDVNFKITNIGGTTIKGVVSQSKPYSLDLLPSKQMLTAQADVSTIMNNKGIIIEAESMVYASVRVVDLAGLHASSVVSKGLAALGTQFRIGAYLNKDIPYADVHYTFASILATENNTKVSFSDIKGGATLIKIGNNNPQPVILNRGQSYVIAVNGPNKFNMDALIGAAITSNKPIAVNCGSFAGTNGGGGGMDLGFDQIVSVEKTGQEYIFVKGKGTDVMERPLIIANENGTVIYLNGNTTPYITLNAGNYITLDGSQFSADGNLYVRGSKNFFAYQGIGGSTSQANQNMHFVPPLSCETPRNIDGIPLINEVGGTKTFTATANIVTEKGATLTFMINGATYTAATLPTGVLLTGPFNVNGNSKYVTYILNGLKGNVSVLSNKQLYLYYFGTSGAATYGGYYSGFIYTPELNVEKIDANAPACLSNVKLSAIELSSFDEFEWYLDGKLISGATDRTYTPTAPGLYNIVGKITGCSTQRASNPIPVSICLEDHDNDGVSDYVDIDNDNDGIANCDESYGMTDLDLSEDTGTIFKGDYSNAFTTTADLKGNAYWYGSNKGLIVNQLSKGLDTSLSRTFTFTKPISLTMEYPKTSAATNLLNSDGDFVVEVPPTNTILVLNPDDQLLIDTNYDGIFESGVTQFSSFQIRFRLKDPTQPLAAGTGTFKFYTRMTTSFSITHKNHSETKGNNAIFLINATCLPKDSDGDGVTNEFDLDDDNDGIPSLIEVLGSKYTNAPFADANKNGMSDVNEPGLGTLDSDNDGVYDYLDLDSDNDGIYDLTEAGHTAPDTDNNGIINGNAASFGTNGLYNSLETSTDSGVISYTLSSTDADGIQNYIDSDSDDDGCKDVKEAGFSDSDVDGYLGNNPVTVDAQGKVTSGTDGYTALSNNNYTTSAIINITTQPADQLAYPNKTVSFTVASNADSFQWQVCTDGKTYNDITDDATYSGSKTAILQVANATKSMNNYKYKVVLNKSGNSCGAVSSVALLKYLISSTVDFIKCDDDMDGFTVFNLKEKENQLSAVPANQSFTYFSSLDAAVSKDSKFEIANPQAYNNSNGNAVYARVENTDGTFTISEINLIISVTQIAPGQVWNLAVCDDYIDVANNDKDGVSSFDFQSVTPQIIASLPGNATYSVRYFKNLQDAVAEKDAAGNSLEITNIDNYRNTDSPNSQTIWVLISSNSVDACVGLGPYLELTVNPLPNIELKHKDVICSGTSITIDAGLISGSQSDYSYQWSLDGQPIPTAQSYSFTADTAGIYTCVVKDLNTGCESIRTNTVTNSKMADIDNVEIHDFSENNKVIVIASGTSEYEYSLDSETGTFYDSNVFENVKPGFHVVYVNDKNGCGFVSEKIAVVGAPPFFTPNGDGINETWKLEGIDADYLKNSRVDIFDRYGKLLYVLPDATSEGWNGYYNNNPSPSNDYWFAAYLEDGRVGKGHFTLKR